MRPPDTEQPIEITLDGAALTGTTRTLITEGDRGESRRLEVKVPPASTRALAYASRAKDVPDSTGVAATSTW